MAKTFVSVMNEGIQKRGFDLSLTFHHPTRVKIRVEMENLLAHMVSLPKKWPKEVLDGLACVELVDVLAELSLDEPMRLCRLSVLVEEKKRLSQEKVLDNPT